MTTIYLVRHAACDPVGRSVAGRAAGVHLNEQGVRQAAELARMLAKVPFAAVYSSPLERACETAEHLAAAMHCELQVDEDLTELDFGVWTGKSFAELDRDSEWRRFNCSRAHTTPPGGESMLAVQARVIRAVDHIRQRHERQTVAVVSHGDVIRAALLALLSMPLDSYWRLEVEPASVAVVELDDRGGRLLRFGEAPAI